MPEITWVCAYDIHPDGGATPITEGWPAAEPGAGAAYRWLHFDLATPGLRGWMDAHLPPLAAASLCQTETRPRCDMIPGGMILNLRGVNLNPGADAEDMVSLRLWIAEGLVVTSRHRKIRALDAMRADIEAGQAPPGIGPWLAQLAFGLTKRIETVSLELVEETDAIEERAIHPGKGLSSDIAALRQTIIKLRRFVRPQSVALENLLGSGLAALDADSLHLLADTRNRALRTLEELDATGDRLSAMQDNLDVLHAAALGRNSYILSVVASIFLPLGFLTGLFGINVGGMPGVNAASGFWLVTAGSVILGAALFALFRWRKWL